MISIAYAGACVAGLVDSPVTIKNIEYAIVERAWEEGWITPRIPMVRTGRSVAVVGSGPAGLGAEVFFFPSLSVHLNCSCGRLPEPNGSQSNCL